VQSIAITNVRFCHLEDISLLAKASVRRAKSWPREPLQQSEDHDEGAPADQRPRLRLHDWLSRASFLISHFYCSFVARFEKEQSR
jgi:hypothetical protein